MAVKRSSEDTLRGEILVGNGYLRSMNYDAFVTGVAKEEYALGTDRVGIDLA